MTKKTIIQQINEKMKTATKTEAFGLMRFYSDNSQSRNKKFAQRNERYAVRIEKLGEKKWGVDWWKK